MFSFLPKARTYFTNWCLKVAIKKSCPSEINVLYSASALCLCVFVFSFSFCQWSLDQMASSPPINKLEDGSRVEIYEDVWVVFTYKKDLACLFRLIKEFDREVKDVESRNDPGTNKMLNEKKQSMVGCYLNLYL